MKVKLDTGAQTCVMILSLFNKLPTKPQVRESSVAMTAYGGHEVTHKGKTDVFCKAGNKEGNFEFYVVDTSAPPILWLQASAALDLLRLGANEADVSYVLVVLTEHHSSKAKSCLMMQMCLYVWVGLFARTTSD